jgi:hypothetical protein
LKSSKARHAYYPPQKGRKRKRAGGSAGLHDISMLRITV